MRSPRIAFQREHTGSALQDRVQRQTETLTKKVGDCPFIHGVMKSVSFTGAPSSVIVNHGLGEPAACMVARLNYHSSHNGPRFTEGDQSGIDINNQLNVTADAICIVDLWFYPRSSKDITPGSTQSA